MRMVWNGSTATATGQKTYNLDSPVQSVQSLIQSVSESVILRWAYGHSFTAETE